MPSFTSVKDSVTEVLVVLTTARSLTVPGSTAARVTVSAAVPLTPSLVAVIVAVPAPTPVTSPLVLTVPTPAALDAQATVRPDSTVPLASFSVALSCSDCPTVTFGDAGLTTTVATAAGGGDGGGGGGGGAGTVVTVTVALPLVP